MDQDCVFEFTCQGFAVINIPTGRIVARGSKCGNLYILEQVMEAALLSNPRVGASEDTRYRRLGHCTLQTLQKLQKNGNITINNKHKDNFLCESCQMAKSHKLPFVSSSHKTLGMFERIH